MANTKKKLARLEALRAAHENETGGDEELREMTTDSISRLINQLKEEIARYEARAPARR
ncbi:MAG TPA: hypothetical protein VKA15_25855 [Isosphaeraceae bacterium]|nr:hypothetical protein [Isosphaeraceae bacterium]